MNNAIARLISPRSVAVIGASSDPTKTSGRPVAYLQKHGFEGRIYPVNPKADRIGELPCYPDIASLPEVPDVGIVLLGAKHAHTAVRALSELGCPAAIVLASGYGETDEAGKLRQEQLLQAAGEMRLLGPNTIGLVNLTERIVLSPSGALAIDEFPIGNIGVVSQSGGILGSLLSRAAARDIGLSKLIATSNEVDLDLADFVDYLAEDASTSVIALYVEAVRNTDKFRAACVKARSMGKPVVVFKIGRSEAGARAAVSHTGAMAGADAMYDALFRQVGIIRAQTFTDLLDISAALATRRKLLGKRVAILTSTGGAGTLVSDDLGLGGFETPAPDEDTAAALRALQTGSEAVLDRNPIDVTLAGLRPDLLRGAISTLLASPSYDALLVIVGSSSLAQPALLVDPIEECLPTSDKPILAYVSPHAPDVAALLTRRGVPAFAAAESCTAALEGMWQVEQFQVQQPSSASEHVSPEIIASLPRGVLDETQAKLLYQQFGIAAPAEKVVTNIEEAVLAATKLGGKVVLKILSSNITHKSDVGGVAIGLDATTIGPRLTQMSRDVEVATGERPQRFVVQAMVNSGTELILGMHRDTLGTAILLGMGGVTAELFQDTTMRLLPGEATRPMPLSHAEAGEMARELKTWPLLDGFRGRPKADINALTETIVNFSRMVAALGNHLLEAEINPLFVLPRGEGAIAADAVVVLAEGQSSSSKPELSRMVTQ